MAVLHIEKKDGGFSVMITPNGHGAGTSWSAPMIESQLKSYMLGKGIPEEKIAEALETLYAGKAVSVEL